MSLEFQALYFLPEGGGLKVEAFRGLGNIRICHFSPAYTTLLQLKELIFFSSSRDQSLRKVQLVSRMRQLEN